MKRTETRTITEEELQAEREKAARRALESFADEYLSGIEDVELLARVQTGLVTTQDVAKLYDTSERTVRSWPIEPVRTDTRPHLYAVEDLPEQMEA